MDSKAVRLNKYVSAAGVCSRREADRLILNGCVTVDGEKAVPGIRILPDQDIRINGRPILREAQEILLAFHKPAGVVCTTSHKDPDNIVDYIHYPKRIFPIGRLDKESEGLILLTNRGEIADKLLRGSNLHEKEYIVRVNKPVTDGFLSSLSRGVPILDTVTRPCRVERRSRNTFDIVLTQGLNRQIRRMCEHLDYKVISLCRVRIMNITLGNLKKGTWRPVAGAEKEELYRGIGIL